MSALLCAHVTIKNAWCPWFHNYPHNMHVRTMTWYSLHPKRLHNSWLLRTQIISSLTKSIARFKLKSNNYHDMFVFSTANIYIYLYEQKVEVGAIAGEINHGQKKWLPAGSSPLLPWSFWRTISALPQYWSSCSLWSLLFSRCFCVQSVSFFVPWSRWREETARIDQVLHAIYASPCPELKPRKL